MSNEDPTKNQKSKRNIKEFRARKAIQKAQYRTLRELSKSGQRARINFILPRKMKADWLALAIKLNLSLSQLIRQAVENFYVDLVKSGNIAQNGSISEDFISSSKSTNQDKNSIKKRIRGLIKIQKNIPIQKLALAVEITEQKAEKLIYELAAEENIEAEMKGNIFEFSNDPEIIISLLSKLIDNL